MKTDFRTIVQPQKADFNFTHENSFFLTGSCFSENIGKKLADRKFNSLSNPLGISYNPISIHHLLRFSLPVDIEKDESFFFSYQLHSGFSSFDKEELKGKINKQLQLQQEQLSKDKGVLIITYGTAWVYELKSQKEIVNNCHKQPSALFTKRLLSIDEILDSFNTTNSYLKKNYPEKQIIFTVSPVRHWKDGVRENQLSKSILHLALNRICSENYNCSYFPSYEIMMDDLRDYRFYKEDLLHPNEQAIKYIWKRFSDTYFSEQTASLNIEIEKINTALTHKPFHSISEAHQNFLKKLLTKTQQLQAKKGLNFEEEQANIIRQIV